MTEADIIAKLFVPVNAERIAKAKGMASRAKIDWARVLEAMTDAQRKAVDDAQVP